jgi:hypothetical protein
MKDNQITKLVISAVTSLEIEFLRFLVIEKSLLLGREHLTVCYLKLTSILVIKQKKKKIFVEIQEAKFGKDGHILRIDEQESLH